MKRPNRFLNRLFRRRGFGGVWKWAKGHGPYRWRLALHWAEDRLRWVRMQPRTPKEAEERWQVAARVYRRRLRKARRRQEPRWRRYMGNGYNANVNPRVKAFVARGVVKHDCYVTSLRRDYVPPGGSLTSYHLRGMAADLGGKNMARFQRDEYERNMGNRGCLELYGPDNNASLRNGAPAPQPEGSANETLHDTHTHGAFA